MKTPRKTHPQAPLFYPPQVDLTPEQTDQISVDFSQLTGQASDAQVPESAVTQHEAALALSFTQMTDNPTGPQKANILASAALTGTPTAPTPAPGDNDTSVATTAFVTAAVAAGGSGPPSRGDVSVTTASLANNATENGVIALGKSSLVMRFVGSVKCRIRLYSTAAYRAADASRVPGIDPQGEHGVMLDILLPVGNLTWDLSPLSLITNDDGPPVSNIYYAIQNLSGAPAAVTATLTRILLEA
jgi:hypothetical protein